jgi:hypothetical protein
MIRKIQVKRGNSVNLPLLDIGEPAFTTDTERFFVGSQSGNVEFAKKNDIDVGLSSLSKIPVIVDFVANEGQYEFVLPYEYTMGLNLVSVWVEGIEQEVIETSGNSISLSENLTDGTKVRVQIYRTDGENAQFVTNELVGFESQLAQSANVVTIEGFSGTTDTEKINNAATSISTTGGTIKLKNKKYNFHNIVLPDGVNILGSGNTIIEPTATANYIFLVKNNSVVKDLTINDNGIYLKAGLQVGEFGSLVGIGKVKNVIIEGVFINLTYANGGGIKAGHCENVSINKCFVKNTATGDFGIVVHSDSPNTVDNVFITNNVVDGFNKGICCWGTGSRYYINVGDNIVKNCPVIGIDMYHSGLPNTFNNTVYNCGMGIFFDSTAMNGNSGRGSICSNNQVHNCTGIGIYAEELRNGVMSGNTVQSCDIGMYAGASTTYTMFEGNGLTFNRVGIKISNDHVPSQMYGYDNGDIKIANNTIAFNSQNGIELAGIRGLSIIENNDIRSNNTSNGDYYAILLRNDVIASISRDRQCEQVIIKGNTITNQSNTNVTQTTGYQKGIKNAASMGVLTIVDNILNNVTTELALTSLTVKFMKNIVNSALATPTIFTSVTLSTFGNIGLYEGQLVATGSVGISLNTGIPDNTTLPVASSTYRGQIIRVDRFQNGDLTYNDDTYYTCVRLASGSYAWKKITLT